MKLISFLAAAGAAGLLSGCAHQSARKARADHFLAEESRALTTAVVDTLSEQPPSRRDAWSTTALLLARQDQRLEGLPAAAIRVEPLISSNAAAQTELAARFARENAALAAREDATEKLTALGEQAEKERAATQRRWFKRGGILTTLLAGFVLLAIFCPIAIPILGRLLGWLVEKLPGWAGALGVVSVKAFDAVVRGVEKTRKAAANTSDWSVPVMSLDTHLAEEMDAAHKELMRARQEVIGQP